MEIAIASSNKNKIKEIKQILNDYKVHSCFDIIKPFDIEENGKSFKENATIKAKAIYKKIGDKYIILSDDSGISVPLLNGAPGIHSARYSISHSAKHTKANANDKDNLQKLIKEIQKMLVNKTQAYYTCAIAIASQYGVFTTHGFMHGHIIDTPKGNKGFGYDPIFMPEGFNQTLGEIEDNIKSKISHRSKALHLAKLIIPKLANNYK